MTCFYRFQKLQSEWLTTHWLKTYHSLQGLFTWTLSMTQRSPTSNGCMMNMKMIASTRVLHTLPNRNAMSSICENTNTSRCIGEIPNMSNQTISTVSANTTSSVLCSFFTAVSMSLNDNAKALLSLYTATCRDHSHPKGCNQNQVCYLLSPLHVCQNGNVVE